MNNIPNTYGNGTWCKLQRKTNDIKMRTRSTNLILMDIIKAVHLGKKMVTDKNTVK